jgi:DNA polymerase
VDAHIDIETGSATDLRKAGVHRYAECSTTRAWGFCYALGDEPPRQWRPGQPAPAPLLTHIERGGIVHAHNAIFERTIWNVVLCGLEPRWPRLHIEQQRCTLARAAAVGLPQDLDTLSEVLNQKQKKDKEGALIMRKMSKPRRITHEGIEWWDTPALLDRNMAYCEQDVRTERETDRLLPPLSPAELEIWFLDQHINDRGIYIDIDAVTRAVDIVEHAKRQADREMKAITGGQVKRCTEVAQILKFIRSRGLVCEQLRKGDHDEIMVLGDIAGDPVIRKVVELRREASKTSTAKYTAMLNCVCADGRIRGQFAYHGAGPGRWAGRLVQPQNLVRVDEETESDMVRFVDNVLDMSVSSAEGYELIRLAGYPVLPALAKAMRSMLMVPA